MRACVLHAVRCMLHVSPCVLYILALHPACGAAQAAEKGFANAQYELSRQYHAELPKAVEWLRKAAEQGHPQAQATHPPLLPAYAVWPTVALRRSGVQVACSVALVHHMPPRCGFACCMLFAFWCVASCVALRAACLRLHGTHRMSTVARPCCALRRRIRCMLCAATLYGLHSWRSASATSTASGSPTTRMQPRSGTRKPPRAGCQLVCAACCSVLHRVCCMVHS